MPGTFSCPTDNDLQSFVLGKHSPAEVEQLADHIEQCSRCSETLDQFMAADTLADPLKDQTWSAEARSDAVVANLIEKLSALPVAGCDTFVGTAAATPAAEGEPNCLEFLAPAEAADELGRLASYRVLGLLGHGGMGIVFHAEDIQLRRPVALKVMNPALAASSIARQRFVREAQAAAAVAHDHIVSIFQVGEDRGVPYLAMPLLQGESLEERLRRVGKLPLTQVLRIGREIAEGLAAAHQHGLIHRDIKPANVFLEAGTDRVKIVDFGLARATKDDARLTHTGTIMGTPAYMAPEQARGEVVDGRSDLFSLGCVLYRMCTGVVPFKGPDVVSTLTALALNTPTSPREISLDVPQALSDLILQLLSKNPADRPASDRAVADRLGEIEREQAAPRGAPVAMPLPAIEEQRVIPRTAPRRRWLGRVAVAALLFVGGGIAANQIIIRIKNKDGSENTIKADVAKESTITVEYEGNEVKVTSGAASATKIPAAVKPVAVKIERDPLPEFAARTPLNALALVTGPDALKGVRSWTVETRGSRGAIRSVAYSFDGRRVAAASLDGTIRIFEVETARLLRVLVDPQGSAGIVAWSPDDKTLASSSEKTVRLWDVESGRLLRSREEHTSYVAVAAWSPDGTTLATGANDNSVRLWNVADGQLRDTLQLHKGRVNALAWSPDGKILASGSEDATVRLWDAESGNHRQVLEGNESAVRALAWSPDGTTVVSGGDDKVVRKWNAESGKPSGEIKDLAQPVRALVWLADGKRLAIGHANGAARLVEVEPGHTLREVLGQAGQEAEVAWAPHGRTVAFGGSDGTLRVWDARTGKLQASIAGHKVRSPTWNYNMPPLAWSPDGKMLAYGTLNSHVQLWDLRAGQLLRSLKQTHAGPIVSLSWSPDSTQVASGGSDNTVRLWDVASGEEVRVCSHVGWISGLAWSPDGKTIASGGQDSTVRLWEAATGRQLHKLEGHKLGVEALAWSPDSKRLISGSYDQTLRIWDAETGKQLLLVDRDVNDQPLGENRAASWSPDGKTIAAGGIGMWLWDAASGKIIRKYEGGGFRNVAFSPDGKTLASGFGGGIARTWEAETGTQLRKFEGHDSNVEGVTWSPDGKTLACASANYWTLEQLRLWDARSGRLVAVLTSLAHPQGVAVSPTGHFRGTPGLERELVYVVETDAGQETLTPEQFAAKFAWKNDPAQVLFAGE